MSINLLSDKWIPAIRNGQSVTIRPDQIADTTITRLAWHRADFNLACLELLIGLVSMAYPPKDVYEWQVRFRKPDAERFRSLLKPFTEYFELSGNGPRFMQDEEAFELSKTAKNKVKPVDMLFIDSAGSSTTSKNADLMVKRNRFTTLSPAVAAMAIYTLQAYAPSGGAGNRTSIRGGGPMTTLIQPISNSVLSSLWRLVFSNVLPRLPIHPEHAKSVLPWLRPTLTSEKRQMVTQDKAHDLESFFGMPRRLRLLFHNDRVVGVVQKPYGTNYQSWEHPLSPYYKEKVDSIEWLPVHPKPGRLSYRNWLGITMRTQQNVKGTRRLARVVQEYENRLDSDDFELLVGGWAMDNMKPLDFSMHVYPGFSCLDENHLIRVHALVDAANLTTRVLRKAFKRVWFIDKGESSSVEVAIERFFVTTQSSFENCVKQISENHLTHPEESWFKDLQKTAIRLYDEYVLNGLSDQSTKGIKSRVESRKMLVRELTNKVRSELGLSTSKGTADQ